jgi:hypothetical protein
MRTYFDAAVPADPRVVLAALDRRLAQGVAGHALAARMRAHRERLLRQIEQEDASG